MLGGRTEVVTRCCGSPNAAADSTWATCWGSVSDCSGYKVLRSNSARTCSSWGAVLEVSGNIPGWSWVGVSQLAVGNATDNSAWVIVLGLCQQPSGQDGDRDLEKLRVIREARRMENTLHFSAPLFVQSRNLHDGAQYRDYIVRQ